MAINRSPMRFSSSAGNPISRFFASLAAVLALSLSLVWTGCDPSQPQVDARWRFVGLQTLSQQTNAPDAATWLSRPEFTAARGALVGRVSATLWELATGNTNLPAPTRAALEPVVSDLLDRLSLGQVLRGPKGQREWSVAVKADATRLKAWETAWTSLFNSGRGASKASVSYQGGWIVAVSDTSLTPPKSAILALAQIPAEPQSVFRLDGQWPGVARFQLTAAARDGAIRTEAKWDQDQKLPNPLPAWERPAFIRDPLLHFTAARGVSGWLKQWGGLNDVFGADVPDQVFAWGRPAANTNTPPLQTYLAARVAQPDGWIARAAKAVQPFYPAPPAAPIWSGQLSLDTSRSLLAVSGFPPVNLARGADDSRNYVVLGMMPQGNSKLAFPKELAAQVEQPDVLAYQWENVGEALGNFNAVAGASDILRRRLPSSRRPGIAWALSAAGAMGDAVTVVRVTGPSQLTVKRKSPAGLAASELVWLGRWIDGESPLRPQAGTKAH